MLALTSLRRSAVLACSKKEQRVETPHLEKRIKTLDKELTAAWNGYARSRFELGRILEEMHELLSRRFRAHLEQRNFARSTAYDLLADFRRVKDLPAIVLESALEMGIDIAASRHSAYIEANRHKLKTPVAKTAAIKFLTDLENAGKRRGATSLPTTLGKYERRRHDAFRSLIALGDTQESSDLVQEFREVVAAAAYQLGIEDRIVVKPAEGPRWLVEGIKDSAETVA